MSDPVLIDRTLLRTLPLPAHDGEVDKDARGRALIVGGCREMPGALLLSGVAALRAGAGKLQLATAARIAQALAMAIPETFVIGLAEDDVGAVAASAGAVLAERVAHCDALLIGPGLAAGDAAAALAVNLLKGADAVAVILDAAPLAGIARVEARLQTLTQPAILTPHAGEMASMMAIDRAEVLADPIAMATRAARRFNAIIVLKGSTTIVAAPDGRLFHYHGGGVGLATSGSGDTLAGLATGFAARGAEPLSAAVWAVFVHGEAGRRLGRRIGRVGFLAREILDEVPGVIGAIEA
ncbi:NAD(P)H-hydrate dehydratase [Sandarakinorhabdus sp. DWP1-3-1]|uniref:NAD(P)H-hydrate dehydratase n=1 Tax=Sandarakinorhabdus sp. DWP1-3-1 TaxID=2804627 RepID=UPI003CE6A310